MMDKNYPFTPQRLLHIATQYRQQLCEVDLPLTWQQHLVAADLIVADVVQNVCIIGYSQKMYVGAGPVPYLEPFGVGPVKKHPVQNVYIGYSQLCWTHIDLNDGSHR